MTPARLPLRRLLAALFVASLLMVIGGCTGADTDDDPSDAEAQSQPQPASGDVYQAEWLIDPTTTGEQAQGVGFVYRELFDVSSGRFLVQSPNHLALQNPQDVTFCAAILRPEPWCARAERAPDMPDVHSYPVQLLRTWSPATLFELASWRELRLASDVEPDVWSRSDALSRIGVPVECFSVVGETTAALRGFEACFTDDDLHLVASIDLQGDGVPEVDLVFYERAVPPERWTTGLDEFVEDRSSLQEQLLRLFPEIPAARATPTPEAG